MTTATKRRTSPKATAKIAKRAAAPANAGLSAQDIEYIDHIHEEGLKPDAKEIDLLIPSPTNPRKEFPQDELVSLAQSYRGKGMIQAITVRPWPESYFDRGRALGLSPAEMRQCFEIVAGERRWRAAKLAGIKTVPVVVRDLDQRQVLDMQIVENLQRVDLNPIEKADSYRVMLLPIEQGGAGYASQKELADELGISQGQVANQMRLLELPEPWRGRLISREILPSHARELLRIAAWPEALKWMEGAWKTQGYAKESPALDEWERVVHNAATSATASLRRGGYVSAVNGYVNVSLGKKEIAANPELGIIEWEDYNGEKLRATNVKLAERLLSAKFNAEVKRRGKEAHQSKASPAKNKADAKARQAKEAEKAARSLEA